MLSLECMYTYLLDSYHAALLFLLAFNGKVVSEFLFGNNVNDLT